MIDQVLVPQSQSEDALPEQLLCGVLAPLRIAMVDKTLSGPTLPPRPQVLPRRRSYEWQIGRYSPGCNWQC
jgi:hypothetical protein